MKCSLVAALGGAIVLALGATSVAQAAIINFSGALFDGAPTYVGTSLDESQSLDLDESTLLVGQTGPGDASGLSQFDQFTISPANIQYGFGGGPNTLPGAGIAKSWVGDTGDAFTETLTEVDSINRDTPNAITLVLSGTVSDTAGVFDKVPVFLIISGSQVGGPGTALSIGFTDMTAASGAPETSTWVMLTLGFAAVGYAAFRKHCIKSGPVSA
jgi:hypothetical protein